MREPLHGSGARALILHEARAFLAIALRSSLTYGSSPRLSPRSGGHLRKILNNQIALLSEITNPCAAVTSSVIFEACL
jgi:hypothetical protein